MTTEYAEVGKLALLRQVARPVLVTLEETVKAVWVAQTAEEWRALHPVVRDRIVRESVSNARSRLLSPEQRVVGRTLLRWEVSEPDEWGRVVLLLAFATAQPAVLGLTPEHVDDAWNRGYLQIIVMRGDLLREGWDR